MAHDHHDHEHRLERRGLVGVGLAAGILPQRTSPVFFGARKRKTSIAVIATIANRTERTWGTESRMRTVASTKYP